MSPEPIIRLENVTFAYNPQSRDPIVALKNVNLAVFPGDYVVIVGHNGSGKSTLAKHLNALLLPTEGTVWVNGLSTREAAHTLAIRSRVGMVFQVPDNQIVASTVEEDVAFGPENLGIPPEEIQARVRWALEIVDMLPERRRAPNLLSAGQKQRVAIAGIIAMKPDVLVLDESTAMLDPAGRQEVLQAVRRLNQEEGVTVIAITHFMHEATQGSRVLVMEAGRIIMDSAPRQVFSRVEELRALQLDVPQPTDICYELSKLIPGFPPNLLTVHEVVEEVSRRNGRPH